MAELDKELLRELFFLEDDPFNPEEDSVRGFTFNETSLMAELDLFTVGDLRNYYILVDPFDSAINNAQVCLNNIGYLKRGGSPPIFMIYGENGAGRSSMAFFIAYLVKQLNQAASLVQVPIEDANFGKHIFNIKIVLETRGAVDEQAGKACAAILETYTKYLKPEDPDISKLKMMFGQLKTCMKGLPPLILVFEKLGYDQKDWPLRIYEMVKALNIVPIFLTDHPSVYSDFKKDIEQKQVSGVPILLRGLSSETALQFLTRRVETFRRRFCPVDNRDIYPVENNEEFPYVSAEIAHAFADQATIRIKFLLTLYHSALISRHDELKPLYDTKRGDPQQLYDLISPDQRQITWKDFEKGYQAILSNIDRPNKKKG